VCVCVCVFLCFFFFRVAALNDSLFSSMYSFKSFGTRLIDALDGVYSKAMFVFQKQM